MKEVYKIDEDWRLRPWRDRQREELENKDGEPRLKRYKNGQVTVEGIVFSFSVYETKTPGYLLRGHMSMRSPRDNKVMQIGGSDRKRIIAALEQAEKNVYDNEIMPNKDVDSTAADAVNTDRADSETTLQKIRKNKRVRELMIQDDFFVSADDPKAIREKVMEVARTLYRKHYKLICSQNLRPVSKDLTPLLAFNVKGQEFIHSITRSITERDAKKKLNELEKLCRDLPSKVMDRISAEDIGSLRKRLLENAKDATVHKKLRMLRDFWEYCLAEHIIEGRNPVEEFLKDNTIKTRKTPEALANKEAQSQSLTDEVERALDALIEENIGDGRLMSIALVNGGGIPPSMHRTITWANVTFDPKDPDDARVNVRKDEIRGGTHDYTRPLFRAEGHLLRLRYEYLLTIFDGNEELIRKLPIVSAKDDPTKGIKDTKVITACIRDTLLRAGVKNSALASSRNKDRRVGMGTQLLLHNYEAKILECGVESDSALKDFLMLRQIYSVTGDRYRDFTCELGQKNIRHFLDRLGRFDPPAEKRSRKTRFRENGLDIVRMDRAGPLHCNSMEATIRLKKGDEVVLGAKYGIAGELYIVSESGTDDLSKKSVTKLY